LPRFADRFPHALDDDRRESQVTARRETTKIFGFAGWSGSGKTTLMTALIPELVGRGVAVWTVKHAHHAFDVERPGNDSWRHRVAGAVEVMVASERRWALMHELREPGRRSMP
jgi:molybdopterin-guanine dinucleotide biosynthesis protein MobB